MSDLVGTQIVGGFLTHMLKSFDNQTGHNKYIRDTCRFLITKSCSCHVSINENFEKLNKSDLNQFTRLNEFE